MIKQNKFINSEKRTKNLLVGKSPARSSFLFCSTEVSDMAAAKLVALLLLLALVFNFTTCIFADAGIDGGDEPKLRSDGGDIELDQLNAKIRALGYTQNFTVTSILLLCQS